MNLSWYQWKNIKKSKVNKVGYFEIIPGTTKPGTHSPHTLSEELSPPVSNLLVPSSKAHRHCAEQREVVLEVTITFRLLTATESLFIFPNHTRGLVLVLNLLLLMHGRAPTCPVSPHILADWSCIPPHPLQTSSPPLYLNQEAPRYVCVFSFLFFTLFLNFFGLYCEGAIGPAVDHKGGEKVFLVAEHRGPVLGERRLTVGYIQSEALSCGWHNRRRVRAHTEADASRARSH